MILKKTASFLTVFLSFYLKNDIIIDIHHQTKFKIADKSPLFLTHLFTIMRLHKILLWSQRHDLIGVNSWV